MLMLGRASLAIDDGKAPVVIQAGDWVVCVSPLPTHAHAHTRTHTHHHQHHHMHRSHTPSPLHTYTDHNEGGLAWFARRSQRDTCGQEYQRRGASCGHAPSHAPAACAWPWSWAWRGLRLRLGLLGLGFGLVFILCLGFVGAFLCAPLHVAGFAKGSSVHGRCKRPSPNTTSTTTPKGRSGRPADLTKTHHRDVPR